VGKRRLAETENYALEGFVIAGCQQNRLPLVEIEKVYKGQARKKSINAAVVFSIESVSRHPVRCCQNTAVGVAKQCREDYLYNFLGQPSLATLCTAVTFTACHEYPWK